MVLECMLKIKAILSVLVSFCRFVSWGFTCPAGSTAQTLICHSAGADNTPTVLPLGG
jgi:hypothetical protein